MGNYASCALSGHNKPSSSAAIIVIFSNGEIKTFSEAITAAELMLETSDSFLVDSRSLQIGRRFSALGADEELEIGGLYALIPKQRLNSVVNTADMGALFLATKRGSNNSISTNDHPEMQVVNVSAMSMFEDVDDHCLLEVKQMLCKCRSKKPLLDTIVE